MKNLKQETALQHGLQEEATEYNREENLTKEHIWAAHKEKVIQRGVAVISFTYSQHGRGQ